MAASVADVSCVETQLTPERVRAFAGDITRAGLLVVDANLTREALAGGCAAKGRGPFMSAGACGLDF